MVNRMFPGRIRWVAVFAIVSALALATISPALAGDELRLRAELAPPDSSSSEEPSGQADWRDLDDDVKRCGFDPCERLSVEVEDVDMDDGTVLTVVVNCDDVDVNLEDDNPGAGTITLTDGEGELNLDERPEEDEPGEGSHVVPTCAAEDTVTVSHEAEDGTVTVILEGTFAVKD